MAESAEAVAANISSRRNVTIEITNLTNNYCLINPAVYLDSGVVHIPPQPTVRPQKIEVCNISKSGGKASGAVGVLTYDLFGRAPHGVNEKMTIMFSVPFDYNLYKNWFAVGISSMGIECDEKLYKKMYYDKSPVGFVRAEAVGSSITYEGTNLDIKATMSPLGNAIMKVEIWNKLFGPPGQRHF